MDFVWLSNSITLLCCFFEGFLCDTRAIRNWAVNSLWEMAKLAITPVGLCGLRVGEGGRRDSGGAKGEGDDGAGVHSEESFELCSGLAVCIKTSGLELHTSGHIYYLYSENSISINSMFVFVFVKIHTTLEGYKIDMLL